MNTMILNQIEDSVSRLTLDEQLWLIERLAHRIRQYSLTRQPFAVADLMAMAADLEIQAKKIASNLEKDKISMEGLEKKEIIALIAYLQRLGTDIKVKPESQPTK